MVAREFQSYTSKRSLDFVNAVDVVDAAEEPKREKKRKISIENQEYRFLISSVHRNIPSLPHYASNVGMGATLKCEISAWWLGNFSPILLSGVWIS